MSCILQFDFTFYRLISLLSILQIIHLEDFIKLNLKLKMKIRHVEHVEFDICFLKYATVFLNTQILRIV